MSNEENQQKRPLGLALIAIGKAIKVVVLVAVGVVALTMVNKSPPAELLHWADLFRIDPGNRYLHRALEKAAGVNVKQLEELSVGTFLYALVFAIEGAGLWMQKRWAEYLTIGVTLSFIPLEIYEIAHHASAAKIVTLVLNAAALVYLVLRAVHHRREQHHEKDGGKDAEGGSRAHRFRRATVRP